MTHRQPEDYHIRPMTQADLETALGWAAQEGWNPGLHDAALFYPCDPDGFLMGFAGDEPAGSISAVNYGGQYGFVGCYIVRPEHRGGVLGFALARRAAAHLGGMVIGLDGVLERVNDYARLGFELAFSNARYQGAGGAAMPPGLVPLDQVPLERVLVLDHAGFPAPRDAFLTAWIGQPGATALGRTGPEGLRGFGVLRPCGVGHKIGPLFARDPETAELLYNGLCAAAPADGPVFLDVPDNNPEAVALARRHGLEAMFATARMYANGRPPWRAELVYGITTFELG